MAFSLNPNFVGFFFFLNPKLNYFLCGSCVNSWTQNIFKKTSFCVNLSDQKTGSTAPTSLKPSFLCTIPTTKKSPMLRTLYVKARPNKCRNIGPEGCKLASQIRWYPFFSALGPTQGHNKVHHLLVPWGRLKIFCFPYFSLDS